MTEMVACPGCNKEIHRTAARCPHCGAARRKGRYKSKVAAGVLGIFLGGLGVHRFYLGQWWGIFYLLLFWIGIPGLIALIEGIVFLVCDQEKWDEKYNDGIPAANGEGASAVILIVVIVAVGFFGIMVLGILAAIAIPAYHDYTARAKVHQGVLLAAPARTSLDAMCLEGTLATGQTNGDLGLSEPASYASDLVESVVVSVHDAETADITVTFSAMGSFIDAGTTVVLNGACASNGMTWQHTGSMPMKYLPRH